MNKKMHFTAAVLLFIGTALSGCGASAETLAKMEAEGSGMIRIGIINTKGETIGLARLTEQVDGVHIKIEASKLSPGKHGFHVHEYGLCEGPDFKTAGAHLNPEGRQHGFLNSKGSHDGDLPNLEVGPEGTAKAEFVDNRMTLAKSKPNSLLKQGGTSLVIHEGADDYRTDPAGNSGARIACGVIKQ
ncbi:superoxide dismutase family protein [Paenibacillus spongiae]|uniref:Superoxide dismutase [Cu-Zn] n=1 Tax=Paenibacillus spongiae TaxID=2909671 RepID=A0ABY5S5S4_9BACL|nr:superoxide dismutase family protein [Paenibacillus spongiae]UVI29252.1 superoxide dismutase family protein [Paenibacillus spongiae]